eukprot:TRINITY_DN382_c0_g1_i3.p1 TRINITY_DN382_c0_g1~~TRINITY_DN382_c0_g1_i3.p1  ORF type:complete len:161 (-),score=54.23 TRINITY_DN382_c0_g1_i3:197-679(-)
MSRITALAALFVIGIATCSAADVSIEHLTADDECDAAGGENCALNALQARGVKVKDAEAAVADAKEESTGEDAKQEAELIQDEDEDEDEDAEAQMLMDPMVALNASQPGTAFLEEGEGRFRCGVIYCASGGSFCCAARMSKICCGPGARCHRGGGIALCL